MSSYQSYIQVGAPIVVARYVPTRELRSRWERDYHCSVPKALTVKVCKPKAYSTFKLIRKEGLDNDTL